MIMIAKMAFISSHPCGGHNMTPIRTAYFWDFAILSRLGSCMTFVNHASGFPPSGFALTVRRRCWARITLFRRKPSSPMERAFSSKSHREIGRATGRERVCKYVTLSWDAVSLKKQENTYKYSTEA